MLYVRFAARITVATLYALIVASLASSQTTPDTGIPPFGSFNRDSIDAINLGNLNVHFQFPVFAKKGRGLNFVANLVHDNAVLQRGPGVPVVWHLYYPDWYLETPGGGRVTATWTHQNCNGTTQSTVYSNFVYTDAQHTNHTFPDLEVDAKGICYANHGSGESTDGWFISVSFSGSTLVEVVTDPNGDVIRTDSNHNGTSIIDPNGNQISLAAGTWTDTVGSSVLTTQLNLGSSATYTYPNPSGGPGEVVAVTYSQFTFKTQFGCSSANDNTGQSVSLPTQISLPDGTSYMVVYESLTGTYPSTVITGRLHSLTLPSGAVITYSYSGGTNGVNCQDGSPAILTKQTPDGTWTYNHSFNSSTTLWTTVVTDPLGNDSVYTFGNLGASGQNTSTVEVQRLVYQGSQTSGSLLESGVTCYNGQFFSNDITGCAAPPPGNYPRFPILRKDVYTTPPGGASSLSETVYSSTGLLLQDNEYDYGINTGGAPSGTPIRSTLIAYAGIGGNILTRPSCVEVSAGASPSACPTIGSTTNSVTNYLNYDTHGNVGSVQNWVSGPTYLSKGFTYYSTGLVQTSTDVNLAQTTYTYGACNNSYPTTVAEPLNLSRSMTWDCNGGVITSVTDENGQITRYGYNDPFWRTTSITDPLQNITSLTYTPATAESVLTFNGGGSTVDTLTTSDSLGRKKIAQTRQAPNSSYFDTVSYSYDPDGRLASVSVPCVSTASVGCSGPTTSTTYDALNRPLVITDGGGGTITYSYPQNDVLVTVGPAPSGENTKRRQLEYDALGRLTSACEITVGTSAWPGASCGQNTAATGYLTKYTYDALGDLLTVTQNAQSSSNQQTRTYTFDAMGRLTSEKNPETNQTAVTYTYDTDSTCAASKGDLVKKVDVVGNVTCFTYDAMHRELSAAYPSGTYASVTPSKYFVYDSATVNSVAMANAKGRLAEAYTCTTCPGTKLTDLGYSYTGRGEVSDVYESTQHSGGYFHVLQGYWASGKTNYINSYFPMPNITYTPDGEGRVNSVTDSGSRTLISSAAYNSASLPTQVNFGSGDNDVFAYDSNTLRTAQFKFNIGTMPQTYVGTLSWNNNGSLGQLAITDPFNSADTQTCNYSHDDLTRISTANCGSAANQTFSYDAFGNISKSGSPYAFQPTYNSATNRFATIPGTTPSYDANGNVLSDGSHTYSWDADGNSVTVDSVGLTFDALDRMVEQARGTSYTQIVYTPTGDKLALMNGQSTLVKGFASLPGGATAVYTSSGLDHYRHSDWLGSARLTSSPSQAYLSSVAYAPFGETYASSGTTDVSFTGQNPVSSDYDFLYRPYSTQGRWPTPDPSGLAAVDPSNPQSWNRYSYVLNNPLVSVDPFGLDCVYLNDAGTAVESLDRNSDSHECSQNGGTWFDGIINSNSVQTDPNSDWVSAEGVTAGGLSSNQQFSCGGSACGQDSLDSFVNSITGGPSSVTVTDNSDALSPEAAAILTAAGIMAEHGIGCAVPGFGAAAGAGLWKASQPVPGSKPFRAPGTTVGSSPVSEALRDTFRGKSLPFRVPMPVGGPGTGTPLKVAWGNKVGATLGRAAPWASGALVVYSTYELVKCLKQTPGQ